MDGRRELFEMVEHDVRDGMPRWVVNNLRSAEPEASACFRSAPAG